MSKGYWLAIYRAIHDQDQLAEYAKKATVAIAEHGGKFLSRGMPEAMLEGDEATRTVLIEFPSTAAAIVPTLGLGMLRIFDVCVALSATVTRFLRSASV